MRTGQIFIDVRHGHALVSRYLPFGREAVTWEAARNARELEASAWIVLGRSGITPQHKGHYCCPTDLAAQAEFEPIQHL
ncbi:MAG: hypothetical protein JOZ51_04340 [Chloroflexi bacterium]|nr:hypothetical protein [Chloroflexota bacterium]